MSNTPIVRSSKSVGTNRRERHPSLIIAACKFTSANDSGNLPHRTGFVYSRRFYGYIGRAFTGGTSPAGHPKIIRIRQSIVAAGASDGKQVNDGRGRHGAQNQV
jgi:hypothetical protein